MIPPIARRFVAGETPESALEYVRTVNEQGIGGILNLLGEHYTEHDQADQTTATYIDLIETLSDTDHTARVSVKPSQLGNDINTDVFRENLTRIVQHASTHEQFVWIDMENHTTIDPTLNHFETLAQNYPNCVGICIQANMKRSPDDIDRLSGLPGAIRLVKGAYSPSPEIAFHDKNRVNTAYQSLLETLFHTHDHGIGVATHDPSMIEYAIDLHTEHATPFEFQMLMGVRESAQHDLAETYDVWQYIPFGANWAAYFYRRLRERKENVLFALRALVQR